MIDGRILLETPLHTFHLGEDAKMSDFAGYDMPLHYPDGAIAEHKLCREGAAIFDVSHMGQIELRDETGAADRILEQLERLIPANLVDLPVGKQRYGLLLNEAGGILDDLIVSNYGTHVRLIVNAACAAQDLAWVSDLIEAMSVIKMERSLIALQGPASEEVFSTLLPVAREMRFMDARQF